MHARSFLDALDVAREGAVAAARMSFGRRAEGGVLECVWVEDAIMRLEEINNAYISKRWRNCSVKTCMKC